MGPPIDRAPVRRRVEPSLRRLYVNEMVGPPSMLKPTLETKSILRAPAGTQETMLRATADTINASFRFAGSEYSDVDRSSRGAPALRRGPKMRKTTLMKGALLPLILVVGACGAIEKESRGGVGGNGGSSATNAGARNGEAGGGDVSQAQGGEPSPGTLVNRCHCSAGAQPPPECSSEPTPGSACDDQAFVICRVGFAQCFFCLALTPVGCVSAN